MSLVRGSVVRGPWSVGWGLGVGGWIVAKRGVRVKGSCVESCCLRRVVCGKTLIGSVAKRHHEVCFLVC